MLVDTRNWMCLLKLILDHRIAKILANFQTILNNYIQFLFCNILSSALNEELETSSPWVLQKSRASEGIQG